MPGRRVWLPATAPYPPRNSGQNPSDSQTACCWAKRRTPRPQALTAPPFPTPHGRGNPGVHARLTGQPGGVRPRVEGGSAGSGCRVRRAPHRGLAGHAERGNPGAKSAHPRTSFLRRVPNSPVHRHGEQAAGRRRVGGGQREVWGVMETFCNQAVVRFAQHSDVLKSQTAHLKMPSFMLHEVPSQENLSGNRKV